MNTDRAIAIRAILDEMTAIVNAPSGPHRSSDTALRDLSYELCTQVRISALPIPGAPTLTRLDNGLLLVT